MTARGRKDGDPLIVDLRSVEIESWAQLWDALAGPCGLPDWFGRNLDAWWDTIQAGGISEVLDSRPLLVLMLNDRGLFAPDSDGQRFIATTRESDYARVETADA